MKPPQHSTGVVLVASKIQATADAAIKFCAFFAHSHSDNLTATHIPPSPVTDVWLSATHPLDYVPPFATHLLTMWQITPRPGVHAVHSWQSRLTPLQRPSGTHSPPCSEFHCQLGNFFFPSNSITLTVFFGRLNLDTNPQAEELVHGLEKSDHFF